MSASFARNTGSEIVGTKRAAVNENVGGISDQIYCIHQDRETVLQGEVKTPLRERFFAKRSARGAASARTVAKRFFAGKIVLRPLR
jgi:hypothetical protein